MASPSDMTAEEVAAIDAAIWETYQLDLLDDVLGIEIISFGMVDPLPGTDSENWQVYAQLEV